MTTYNTASLMTISSALLLGDLLGHSPLTDSRQLQIVTHFYVYLPGTLFPLSFLQCPGVTLSCSVFLFTCFSRSLHTLASSPFLVKHCSTAVIILTQLQLNSQEKSDLHYSPHMPNSVSYLGYVLASEVLLIWFFHLRHKAEVEQYNQTASVSLLQCHTPKPSNKPHQITIPDRLAYTIQGIDWNGLMQAEI